MITDEPCFVYQHNGCIFLTQESYNYNAFGETGVSQSEKA